MILIRLEKNSKTKQSTQTYNPTHWFPILNIYIFDLTIKTQRKLKDSG